MIKVTREHKSQYEIQVKGLSTHEIKRKVWYLYGLAHSLKEGRRKLDWSIKFDPRRKFRLIKRETVMKITTIIQRVK